MILLSTLWQSGTNYMMQCLDGEVHQVHCGPAALECIEECAPERIVTTFRSPYLVAASWANRYNWNEVWQDWTTQWSTWRELVLEHGAQIRDVKNFSGPPVKITPHDKGAKMAYLAGDRDEYYKRVPEPLIAYALDKINGIRELPGRECL